MTTGAAAAREPIREPIREPDKGADTGADNGADKGAKRQLTCTILPTDATHTPVTVSSNSGGEVQGKWQFGAR